MGTMETLYVTCTSLGTLMFVLVFANYFLDSGEEPEAAKPAPGKAKRN